MHGIPHKLRLTEYNVMKGLVFIFLLAALAPGRMLGQQGEATSRDLMDGIISEYYELNLRVFRENSEVGDIERIFTLFTNDFTYIHPRYGGTYSRETLYDGYLRNLQEGNYDGSITNIKIHNRIFGLNAVAVQKSFVEKNEGGIIEKNPEMTLFEFRDGKICRITEFW